jgi:hypothetical protein
MPTADSYTRIARRTSNRLEAVTSIWTIAREAKTTRNFVGVPLDDRESYARLYDA